jgi:dihydroorotate dehydrogenase electron transfer subunit
MHIGTGSITELTLQDGCHYARVSCPENLVPAPGQYLLASDASDSPLPVPIFYTDSAPGGFIALAASGWKPGDELYLRGPLGRGFAIPPSARKVALIAYDDAPARLRGLIRPALKQDASVVLVSNSDVDSLPDDVEIQPLATLFDALEWADYVAMDISRENLPELKASLFEQKSVAAVRDAEVLIRAPMPCGGIADCGVCAVVTKSSWKMACKDGPVFDWNEI